MNANGPAPEDTDPNEQAENILPLEAALAYASRGWHVVPWQIVTGPDGCSVKRPQLYEWQRRASCDFDELRSWWDENPNQFVGLHCGKSGLVVVDIDVHHEDQNGFDSLRERLGGEHKLQEMRDSAGAVVRTASGGEHWYFAGDDDSAAFSRKIGALPGVDLLLGSSLAFAPGSTGYEWVREPDAQMPEPPVAVFEWASESIRASKSARTSQARWPETMRNDSMTAELGFHRHNGLQEPELRVLAHRLNSDRCVVPLSRDEVDGIVESVLTYEAGDSFASETASYKHAIETEATAELDEAMFDGASFLLDADTTMQSRWGRDHDVLWAKGESMMLVGPPGVGKTTVTGQVLRALVGAQPDLFGLPVEPATRVLYLAMDRPRQVQRALARTFSEDDRSALAERVVFKKGPLSRDLGDQPGLLLEMAQHHGCDVVVVDSLKDAAVKLTDDERAGNVNRAIQMCNASDVDVLVLHHQRKAGAEGSKPTTLADVYGSAWVTAGAGSVVLLWGDAGDELVELSHLKQPAEPIGPWKVQHDHARGVSVVLANSDVLSLLAVAGRTGDTVVGLASKIKGDEAKANGKEGKAVQRRLKRLVEQGVVQRFDSDPDGGQFTATRYVLSEHIGPSG